MAVKRSGLLDNFIQGVRENFRVYLGKPRPPLESIGGPTQKTLPPAPKTPWSGIDKSIVSKTGESDKFGELKEAIGETQYKTQYQKYLQWREQHPLPNPPDEEGEEKEVYKSGEQAELPESDLPILPPRLAPEPEEEVPYFPVARRPSAIPTKTDKSDISLKLTPISREQEKEDLLEKRALYTIALLTRPKSWQDRMVDDLFNVISLTKLVPRPKTTQEQVDQAIQQLLLLNPELAGSEEVKLLQRANKDVAQEINITTGQVKNLRFVPAQRIEEERPRISLSDVLFRIKIDSANNFLSIRQEPLNRLERFLISPAIQRAAAALGKNIAVQSIISTNNLIAGATRQLTVWLVRGLVMAGEWLMGLIASIIGAPGAVVAIGIATAFGLALLFMMTGSIIIRQESVVGGGAGDLLSKGNQYISIEITSPKSTLQNSDLPTDVSFMVIVKPKLQPFQGDPQISGTITASGKDGSKILASQSWTEGTHKIDVHLESLQDVNIILSVTVNAKVADQPDTQMSASNASIRVGNPPDDCPSGWPTPFGNITSEPNDPIVSTHANAEAIDIGNGPKGRIQGAPIYATHKGKVSFDCFSPLYGNCVRITTTCAGKTVYSIYAHMMSRSVDDGQDVVAGVQIGSVGATGNVFGGDPNHLHYEFLKISGVVTIPMAPPYIPQQGKRGTNW